MKARLRILLYTILSLLVIAVTALPVQADANVSPVSGICVIGDEPEFNGDKYTWWTSGNGKYHLRDDSQTMLCDFDDDRLDGSMLYYVNWNVTIYDDPVWVVGQDHGYGTVSDETGTPIWEVNYALHFEPDGIMRITAVWQGIGPYKGLIARTWSTSPLSGLPYFQYDGFIIETGR